MDNLKNNVRELLKNAVVLITLLAVTLILLEIPGRYYQKEDESLFNQMLFSTLNDAPFFTLNGGFLHRIKNRCHFI